MVVLTILASVSLHPLLPQAYTIYQAHRLSGFQERRSQLKLDINATTESLLRPISSRHDALC